MKNSSNFHFPKRLDCLYSVKNAGGGGGGLGICLLSFRIVAETVTNLWPNLSRTLLVRWYGRAFSVDFQLF